MEDQQLGQRLRDGMEKTDNKESVENFDAWALAVRKQMLAALRKRGQSF